MICSLFLLDCIYMLLISRQNLSHICSLLQWLLSFSHKCEFVMSVEDCIEDRNGIWNHQDHSQVLYVSTAWQTEFIIFMNILPQCPWVFGIHKNLDVFSCPSVLFYVGIQMLSHTDAVCWCSDRRFVNAKLNNNPFSPEDLEKVDWDETDSNLLTTISE